MLSVTTEAREGYAADGYVFLPGFFPTEVVSALYGQIVHDLDLARTPQRFARTGPLLTKPAIEVYSHQYVPMAGFLWGSTPVMESIVGCRLVPTYAYFRIYQGNDVCRVHSDRHACQHSLSLTLALADNRPWALAVEKQRRDAPVRTVDNDFGGGAFAAIPMGAGDAVIYQGVNHRHGRLEPNPNQWSAHAFLHWVDRSGPYKDQAFDRPAIAANRSAHA